MPGIGLAAKLATAGGLVLMGGLLWWLGGVWPRHAPDTPPRIIRSPYAARRYPGMPLDR
ncbi:hypothetical protein HNP84_007905 [Thermocatellispora tengchongensis]|uniref:Uncharacterized protein n=1 Tax=Thermocatellispora tengchongensis TaxID=1073253 RepID=A0A840PG75_9ACTN|nr:hypothetical protein [Thermocatellispora tengchongensis]MBB5138152.1 hypothetical protein [Thermocatellispora tengchongensis]